MDSTVRPAGAPRMLQVALAPWSEEVVYVAGAALVPALGPAERRGATQNGGACLAGLVEGALPLPGGMNSRLVLRRRRSAPRCRPS